MTDCINCKNCSNHYKNMCYCTAEKKFLDMSDIVTCFNYIPADGFFNELKKIAMDLKNNGYSQFYTSEITHLRQKGLLPNLLSISDLIELGFLDKIKTCHGVLLVVQV